MSGFVECNRRNRIAPLFAILGAIRLTPIAPYEVPPC
jgi:hypothetical protein